MESFLTSISGAIVGATGALLIFVLTRRTEHKRTQLGAVARFIETYGFQFGNWLDQCSKHPAEFNGSWNLFTLKKYHPNETHELLAAHKIALSKLKSEISVLDLQVTHKRLRTTIHRLETSLERYEHELRSLEQKYHEGSPIASPEVDTLQELFGPHREVSVLFNPPGGHELQKLADDLKIQARTSLNPRSPRTRSRKQE